MELSGRTCRDVEFREKKYGYHPTDVDSFLEELAGAIDAYMAKSTASAATTNAALTDAHAHDDTIGRALLVAQRTADGTVRQAEERARQIIADAHEEARTILTKAGDSAHRIRGREQER